MPEPSARTERYLETGRRDDACTVAFFHDGSDLDRSMSFDHKAFAFDWGSFQAEMAGLLGQALRTGNASNLERFVDANLSACASPYDGKKLDAGWRRSLGPGICRSAAA